MASSINVKIAPLPRGEYSSSATYAKLDVVSYNGSSYMAIKAVPTGTVPTNTTYWQVSAEKATIGEGSITTDMLANGAVTADKLDSSVSDKYAEVSGTYEDMVVGSAEQLLSTQYDTDSVPYAFRKSPYGDREFDEIVGGSIAWNQLLNKSYYPSTTTTNGITFANNGDGSVSVSGTADALAEYILGMQGNVNVSASVPKGHKVLLCGCPSGGSANGYFLVDNNQSSNKYEYGTGKIYEVDAVSNRVSVRIRVAQGTVISTPVKFIPQIIDLTQMFGSAIADYLYTLEQSNTGSGVAWFKFLFSKPYYAFNSGELISVSGLSAHKMTGFNQWDGTYDSRGYIRSEDGVIASSLNYVATDYIRVVPNMTYFMSPTAGANPSVCWYDADKNYISGTKYNSATSMTETAPSNAYYMRASIPVASINAFCINISGDRNGQYEPYESHSYSLDDSITLRGVPKLVNNKVQFDGDIYSSDGTVQRRYGIVDMGSLTWKYSSGAGQMYSSISDMVTTNNALAVCAKYVQNTETTGWADLTVSGMFAIRGGTIRIKDDAYSDATVFTSAMNGVMLVYELATPTTESAEPYVNPQICNEYGTEEYISAEQSGVTMIVGHNTKYPQNLRKKIEGLPWNFSSLIAPTEVTNKATRNYTVGSYLIMNNTLYKVTSAIANGGTITVGSNVTATTIMQEILAL